MYRRILLIALITGYLYLALGGNNNVNYQNGITIREDNRSNKEIRNQVETSDGIDQSKNKFIVDTLTVVDPIDETIDITSSTSHDEPDVLPSESINQNEVVLVKEGWYEDVLVKEAWDEKILVKKGSCTEALVSEAYDTEEMIYLDGAFYGPDTQEGYVCNGCGAVFFDAGINDHIGSPEHPGWHNELISTSDPYWHNVQMKTIHHDAAYKTICEEDEYEIIHHDAEYATIYHEPVYRKNH
ncbi:MAG: hypothetical protein IJI66_07605 [Erysipelotrichaceae bacterium]|nr:hypothetical protein [Erysipelotrichaceae bacterium]